MSSAFDWRAKAACRDKDPELFFPVGNTGAAYQQIEEAKAVCRTCKVIDALPEVRTGHQSGLRRVGRL